MKLIPGKLMSQVDKRAIEEMGIPEAVLIEGAGRELGDYADDAMIDHKGTIVILVGKGNNGADGLAAARFLLRRRHHVVLVLAEPEASFGPGAAGQLRIDKNYPMKIYQWPDQEAEILDECKNCAMLIDALLGTRFHGSVREPIRSLIGKLSGLDKKVVAVDVPSGVEADTGRVDIALHADITVTMIAPKPGLYLYPGANYAGHIVVGDLQTPPSLVEQAPSKEFRLDPFMIRDWLPRRPWNSHKGMNGKIGVVAGSLGYAGAAEMCSKAVVRAGGGLVSLYTQKEVLEPLIIKSREVMVRPLDLTAPDKVRDILKEYEVVAAGPGMGKSSVAGKCLEAVLPQLEVPIVLDADGLNLLAGKDDLLRSLKQKIFTPHPGEMARLMGCSVKEVLEHPMEIALDGAAKWNAVVVLKCAPTLIALPDGTLYMNSTGNSGMATGGCGDVLTGTIAGLLGQGLTLERAACCGVYVHGKAGDLAAVNGKIGLQAGDLLDQLPRAIDETLNYRLSYGEDEFA